MKLFKKQHSEDLEPIRDITDDVQESEFVPYACHYDPFTILTKNGELLQTLKIAAFSYETDNDLSDVREAIRQAVLESVNDTAYALWFHTVRRKSNLDPGGQFPDDVTRSIHQRWIEQNDLTRQFTNELYVTIVREGQSAGIAQPTEFLRGLIPPNERRYRESYLEYSHTELVRVTDRMLQSLTRFGVRKLGMVERENHFYSEQLEFLNKIINLTDDEVPMPEEDLSSYLTTHEITFGYRAMEVRSQEGHRRFGAMLTLKEHQDLPLPTLDQFLQLPVEFIVTQCFDFINRDKAIRNYEFQKRLVQISGDYKLAEISGLNAIIGSNRGKATDYGEDQISVFLLADTVRALEDYVEKAVGTLAACGVITIREDIKFEECYWSQLPANFEFLSRRRSINTARVAGFSSLHNFPSGKVAGNHWGPAVTVLRTHYQTPYFFSFHAGDNGNSIVMGANAADRSLVLNFLLAESCKFSPRIIYFDCDRRAEPFLHAMQASIFRIGGAHAMPLNPLQLPDSEKNRLFLSDWLNALVENNCEPAQCEKSIAYLYSLPQEKRTIAYLSAYINENHPSLSGALSAWHGAGTHTSLFDHAQDTLTFNNRVCAFDMSGVMENTKQLNAVFSYLLQRITQTLDGTPTILVLSEAWKLLGTELIAPRVASWLDMLRKRNAFAILATGNSEEAAKSGITPSFLGKIATQMYLPDTGFSAMFQRIFALSDKEAQFLRKGEQDDMHCLIRRGGSTVAVDLNRRILHSMAGLLSPDPDISGEVQANNWRAMLGQ